MPGVRARRMCAEYIGQRERLPSPLWRRRTTADVDLHGGAAANGALLVEHVGVRSVKGLTGMLASSHVPRVSQQGVAGVDIARRHRRQYRHGPRCIPAAAAASEQAYDADTACVKTWTWRGHRISYEVHGDSGPPVVISHGFGSNARHFRKLTTALGAAGFTVFAPDLLGFGGSDKPSACEYNPSLWAAQQAAFLHEVVPGPAVLVGNSIGSQVAVVTAAEVPDRVRGLLLLNVAAGMNQRGLYDDDPQLKALKPIFLLIEWLLKKPALARFLFDAFRSRSNVEKILREQVYMQAAVTPDLVELLMKPAEDPGALGCFVQVFTGDPGPRPDALAPSLQCPIQLLWGNRDQWTPVDGTVANAFKQLASDRPQQVRFDIINDCGHCPFDDAPEDVLRLALPWLRTVTATA
jgi:pimeloyl-ACP methyl ester carboxylesterase